MKNTYLEILKKSYVNPTPQDIENFEDILTDEGLGKCKPKFHFFAFLFGWFYLLYRRMTMEAMGVLIVSLMIGYILAYAKIAPLLVLFIMIGVNSLLSGFCYYFLYLNKFAKDVEFCGKHNIECIRVKSQPKISYVIIAVVLIVILIWPWIYALISGTNLH